METINYLISVASNLVKNSKYFGYGYLLGYDVDDKKARVIINDGNIYFFDDDTYEMFEDETIMNNEISHIEIYTTEENAPTYNPKYQNKPTAPSSASVNLHWDNEWMQKNVEHEYQRKLLEYQANLINTQMHNQNEERKYQESQGKTREVKYIDICFKDPNIEKLSWKYSEGHFYIKEQLPAVDIVDLDTGKTQKGETPKEEKIIKKIKIGDEKLCYIELAKNLYISHNIKDNVLELNVSNGNHIFITKYTNVDFKQMAKKLKSESRTVENGEKAFKKAELDDGATRFWGMVDDPKVSDTDVLYFLMEYQNIVYEIKSTYKKEDDQYIDYDEEIESINFKLYTREIKLIVEIMFLIYMKRDEALLHAMEISFAPSDLTVFSPGNERTSYRNFIADLTKSVDDKIDEYKNRDRKTGRLKQTIDYSQYSEE